MLYTEEMTTSEILLRLASMRNELLQAVDDIEKISKNICYKAEQTEPQYDIDKGTIKCDNCSESGSYKCSKCDGEMYFKRLKVEDEPQTFKGLACDDDGTLEVEDEPQREEGE